jgi:hypothetical protein
MAKFTVTQTRQKKPHSGRKEDDRIMTHETRAQALLNSPVGSALILDVFQNRHLRLEHFAEPKAGFWLAASAMDFMGRCVGGNGGMNRTMALTDARAHEALALSIVSHPAFAWWWEPVDLANQVWSSPRMPGGNLNDDHDPGQDPLQLCDADSWGKPDRADADDLARFPFPPQGSRLRPAPLPSRKLGQRLEFPYRRPAVSLRLLLHEPLN